MPGRPKTMARRTTDLEYRSVALLDSLRRWKPSLFDESSSFDDVTGDWLCAKYHLYQAAAKFSELANRYRQKVGIEDLGPFYVWCNRFEDDEFSPERVDEIMQVIYSPEAYARMRASPNPSAFLPCGWHLPPLQEYVPIETRVPDFDEGPPPGMESPPDFEENEIPFDGD